MTRYIDADKLIEQFDDTCKYAKPTNDYQRGCNEVFDWFVKIIKNIPTGDVAPKSEIERLKNDNKFLQDRRFKELSDVRRETAREIFAEIEKIIEKHHDECYEFEDGDECDTAITYISYISVDIDELKKKYT